MNAAKITRQSKSNLALTFISLDRERRRDMTTFYAFCRLIDDIADDVDLGVEQKQAQLAEWRQSLWARRANEPPIAEDVRQLIVKYSLTPEMLEEIVAGVEMDLSIQRYATFAELRVYCYRVASAVGLVSIEIFGYRNPDCKKYAIELGLALQTTNIIRDVAKDLAANRIYLPQEDLARFKYSESEMRQGQHNERFVALMEFEADRSRGFFNNAASILPREDRKSMIAAETMASIYRALLEKMARDNFRLFEKNYRLNRLEKAGRIAGQLLKFL
jgi:15-cis-phytoene synthase